MKNSKFLKLLAIPVVTAVVLSLTNCKKDNSPGSDPNLKTSAATPFKGVTITGTVTFPDFNNAPALAKGAVVNLYQGSTASGTPYNTTFADSNGVYKFNNVFQGTYFITAKYNTENTNYKGINGINFATNPGSGITIYQLPKIKNLSLVAYTSNSTLKIAYDTVNYPGFRPATWEIHSKCDFSFPDHATFTELPGGFDVFKVDQFVFDAANPASTVISGYVQLSSISTLEPVRDDLLNGGCVPKTLLINVDSVNQVAVPETDTARFTSTSVVKYGDGYLAHGTLTAFYHHGPGQAYPADTNYTTYAGSVTGPKASVPQQYWNTRVTKPCDLYFVYQGKGPYSFNANGSVKNLVFTFEGEFTIHPQADYYISSGHFADGDIKVKTHVQFLGKNNDTNYPN